MTLFLLASRLNFRSPVALILNFNMNLFRPPNSSGFLRYSQFCKIGQIEIFIFAFSKVVFRDFIMKTVVGYIKQCIHESIRLSEQDRLVPVLFSLIAAQGR